MYWGFMSKALFRLGTEATDFMFSRAGVIRMTSMLSGRVPGFCKERGFVCNFIRKSLSYWFLPSLLAGDHWSSL